MAVTIPQTSRGRVRRRPGAVSATSADVPSVRSARDPGVNVPLLDDFGPGLQFAASGLESTADDVNRIVERNEGLARDADDTSFAQSLSTELRDLQKSADLSDEEVTKASLARMREQKEKILEAHRGGEASRDRLANRLERRITSFNDSLAVLNISAADARLRSSINKKIGAITQDVLQNPEVITSPNPVAVYRSHVGQIEDDIDFLKLNPDQARFMRNTGKIEIAAGIIGSMIQNGQFDRAKAFLRDKEIGEAIPSGTQRDLAQRIVNAEKQLAENRLKDGASLRKARLILGPNATDKEVRATALRMEGVEKEQNLEFFEVGNSILGIDKSTGAVVSRIQGETPEAQAERESKVEKAKLLARMEVVNDILQQTGVGALFGTTSAAGGQAPTQTQPAEGDSGAPTGQAAGQGPRVVGSAGSIQTPFGPDLEASADAQSVARLFVASRALLIAGENAIANNLVATARFIAENSSEIRRQQELDKPISAELAAELGVGVGTTLREVLGVIPRSPEDRTRDVSDATTLTVEEAGGLGVPLGTTRGEVAGVEVPSPEERARTSAIAGARGRSQVKAEEQVTFLQEARVQLDDLLEELDEDPTLVGGVGGLRAKGRAAITLLEDFGLDRVVTLARELAFDESSLSAEEIEGFFSNPTLSALDIIENSVGLILARIRTPAGRIPVELIRLSIADVGLKGLRGSEVVRDRIEFVRDRLIDERLRSIKRRFPDISIPELEETPDDAAPGEDGIPSDIPRFRIEGGQLVPREGGSVSVNESEEVTIPEDEEALRPLNNSEAIENPDGSKSTERTVTLEEEGEFIVAPSLWMGPDGVVDLAGDQNAIIEAITRYEELTGKFFPRFATVEDANEFARERSESGGSASGPLAR